jgi:hypothetical protein
MIDWISENSLVFVLGGIGILLLICIACMSLRNSYGDWRWQKPISDDDEKSDKKIKSKKGKRWDL